MSVLISVYNHKGGIAKTTSVFNMGCMLAKLGKKVLMVDCDPQCNLTGMSLGYEDYDSLYKFYKDVDNSNIYSSLADKFGLPGGNSNLKMTKLTAYKNDNIGLFAGHINFAKFDMILATAIKTASSLPTLKSTISSLYWTIKNAGAKYDIILLDLAPSMSATNQILLTSSDYFIVPTYPDFFCYQAIDSLSDFLPEWIDDIMPFKDGTNAGLPKKNPKFLGVISSNFRVYDDEDDSDTEQRRMTLAYREWAEKIDSIVNKKLIVELEKKSMCISKDFFSSRIKNRPYTLAEIANYNTIAPVAQKWSLPMFELERKHHRPWSAQARWEREDAKGRKLGAKPNIEESHRIYQSLANNILSLINIDD